MNIVISALLRIGLIRIDRKPRYVECAPVAYDQPKIRWPFRVSPWWIWKVHLCNPGWLPGHDRMVGGWFCVFRNRPGMGREEGRILPRRWGVRIIGFEIGDRG